MSARRPAPGLALVPCTFLLLPLIGGCGGGEGGTAVTADGDGGEAQGPAWFEELADERGLRFEHRSGHDGPYLFPEIMCGGAALLDGDGDGDLDAYLVQAGRLGVAASERPRNELYENTGSGRFVVVPEGGGAGDRGYGMGVAAGDADGDGAPDLYVTNLAENALFLNRSSSAGLAFERADGVAAHPAWGTSAAFLDLERDGDLDLFVVNYVRWSLAEEIPCSGVPHGEDYCSPLSYDAPEADVLFRNDGRGRMEDASVAAGIASTFGNGLGIACADYDADGWLDVFVANDGMTNQLWMNQGDGTLRDDATDRGCAVDQNGRTKAGMGVQAIDIDDDGDEDLLVVNLQGESDSYYRNEGDYFKDRTPLVGLAVESRPFTRFGIGLEDFDSDGWLDLYVANGRVTKGSSATPAGWFAEPNLLFRGREGPRFEEVSPRGGLARDWLATSRAVALGDVDDDGGVDALVVSRDAPAALLVNVVPGRGNWISLDVREASGAPALGAQVGASLGERRIRRRVQSAYGYQSANDPRVHLGLGGASGVGDVRVRWCDGSEESFGDLEGGRVVELRRGAGKAGGG